MPETVPDNRVRQPVGAYLREIRESRGLTLEDAAAVTRIGKNYLRAIEEGKFDKLPSAAYVKGFLRIYAGYLGLSGDEVVTIFERSDAPRTQVKTAELACSASEYGAGKSKPGTRGRWLVPLGLLLLIIATTYLFRGNDERPRTAPPPSPLPHSAVPVAEIQPRRSSSVVTSPQPPVDAQQPAAVATSPETPSRGITLKLKVNQDGPLTITIDNDISQRYDLKAGDLIEWKGERVFTLDLGNGGGVEAEFNGRMLKPFGENDKPVHIVLKADGTQP